MSTIDVVVPTFGRPHRVAPLYANVRDASVRVMDVIFVVEADDEQTVEAVRAIAGARMVINQGPRTYAGAINTVGATEADWIFTGADDLRFRRRWDTTALSLAELTGAKVIGTNDLWNAAVLAGQHSTHSLVACDYIAGTGATADAIPGKVLHEYDHNFVDPELVQVAMFRGVYAHCHASIVEHLHPLAGKADTDETYERGREQWDADEALFRERSKMWGAA